MIAIASTEDIHAAVAATTEKSLVVFFSAPWCGGCKMIAPKITTLAEELTASATFVQVSAEELKTLCDEVEVDAFPHFRVYKESKIVGDYTSSKFDKVDAFIRELVAPDTLQKVEEKPESDDTTKEDTSVKEEEEVVAEGEEGTKKRQEREEMETNDEHVVKKAKTDAIAAVEAEEAEEVDKKAEEATEATENVADAEKTEEAAEEAEVAAPKAVETTKTSPEEAETTDVTPEVTEKKIEEVSPAEIDSNDVTTLDATSG